MSKEEATEILKEHFKALYDYVGMEWTSDNDKNIDWLINELEEIIEK